MHFRAWVLFDINQSNDNVFYLLLTIEIPYRARHSVFNQNGKHDQEGEPNWANDDKQERPQRLLFNIVQTSQYNNTGATKTFKTTGFRRSITPVFHDYSHPKVVFPNAV